MKHVLYILIVFLPVSGLYSQIKEITRLSTQNAADTFSESAPVIISENEVIIFYVNATQDTILSTTSRDGGNNWENPIALVSVELGTTQSYYHLTALRSSSGRILVSWAVKTEGLLIFSNDNGASWSQPQPILSVGNPAFNKRVESLNLSQLDDGKIFLCFNDNNKSKIYFIQSSDDGVTWSEEATEVYASGWNKINGLTAVSSTGENILAVFEGIRDSCSGIYKLISTDNGLTWGDTIRIVNTELNETSPKIVKRSDGSLMLTYLREQSTQISNFYQDDIYYMISSDGGDTWHEERRITKYAGNDDFINISHLNGKTFISFASQRFTNNFQICYGILEETEEKYTPPYLLDTQVSYYYEIVPPHFSLRATIIDDDQVVKVDLEMDDMLISSSLYDDGMHDDLEENDNVWGNVFPFVFPRYTDVYEINVNKIILPINNEGILADVSANFHTSAKITSSDNNDSEITANTSINLDRFHRGNYDEGTFLFSAGFFLSGYNDAELWANAVATASLVQDYLPGKVDADPEDNFNVIYTVNKDDTPFGSSWIKWKDAVSLGAEFYDGDYDGIYNPVDKNWNGTWDLNEDMPALIGDETSWCIYNDGVPDSLRRWQSQPQGIEIKQTLFASSLPDLQEVIFIKYSLLNTGSVANEMESVYFGIWEDGDLGNHVDDVVGCDTLLSSGFYYNNTYDEIYGENCPAFFTTLLQGPVYHTGESSDTAKVNYGTLIGSNRSTGVKNLDMSSQVFLDIPGDPNLGHPGNIIQARNFLLGKDKLGIIPDPCSFPYCEVRGGVDCTEIDPHFWASGDPVADVGWINLLNTDHKNLINTGPFQLEKDRPQEIIAAYVMGRGTDYINSITIARENVRRAIAEYESNFASMTYTSPPQTNPVTDYVLYHNYPNPFNPTTTIRYEMPQDGVVTIKIFDILGQEVATTVNEFQKADRYEIDFNGIGLASGVYIYRMKVNDFIKSKKMLLLR